MHNIRLSCHTITWHRYEFEQAIKDIAELGYEGCEVFGLQRFYEKGDYLKSVFDKYSLKLCAAYFGGSLVDSANIESEIKSARLTLEFLQGLGTEIMVVGAGRIKPTGVSVSDYSVLARSLNEIGAYANDLGIRICYHPHMGTLVERQEHIDLLLQLIEPDLVGLAADSAHITLGGMEPSNFFDKYSNIIKYIHFKDLKHGMFVELGQGEINFPRICELLKSKEYKGWITVELDTTQRQPRESARMSWQYLDRIGF